MSPRLLEQIPPLPGWMGSVDPFGFDATSVSLASDARRYTQSTMSYVSMAGLVVAIEQLLSLGESRIEAHARSLAAMLVSEASKHGWQPFRSAGDPAGSSHIISLGRPRVAYKQLSTDFVVRVLCVVHVAAALYLLAPYNDESDINALVEAFARARSG